MGRIRMEPGFTIPELLIALALSSIVLLLIVQMVITTTSTYHFQREMGLMEVDGQFALAQLRRSIQSSDGWSCVGDVDDVADQRTASDDVGTSPVVTTSDHGVSASASDTITVRTGTDGAGTTLGSAASDGDGAITVADTSFFTEDSVVLVADCKRGNIVELAGSEGSNRTVSDGVINHPDGGFDAGATVTRARKVEFAVNDNCLERTRFTESDSNDPRELICGVDELQLRYGVDDNDDGSPNQYLAAGDVNTWGNVLAVRAVVVMRSRSEFDSVSSDYRVFGDPYSSSDGHARKTFTTTVPIRSRLNTGG